MTLDAAVRDLAGSERGLGEALLAVGEGHRDEQDVFPMTRTLARWCDEHRARLGDGGAAVRGTPADRDAPDPEPGMALLGDLRSLHLEAAAVSVNWVVLGQGAQAASNEELLAVVSESTRRPCDRCAGRSLASRRPRRRC